MRPSASRPEATRSSLGEPFAPTPTPGLTALVLLADESRVVLLRFAPGTELAPHDHPRGEEFYVWRGSLSDEHGQYVAGSWVRQPPGSRHCVRSPSGCVLLTYSGHLVAL
ncbi:MAG: cupin domain-containing protein [Myxococcota bacterium]